MNTIKSEKNVKSDSIFGLVRRKIGAWLGRTAKESAKPAATVSCSDAGRTKRPETFRRDVPVNRKPTYRPVARGTTFLVDTANLIGAIGPEQATARRRSNSSRRSPAPIRPRGHFSRVKRFAA